MQAYFITPPGGVQIIAMSISVCLYVCLSTRTYQKPKTTRPNFTNFSVRVTCGRGSVLR